MPIPLASHLSSKVFSKSGSCSNGAYVSFDLRASKACCCTSPHRNGTPFFVNPCDRRLTSDLPRGTINLICGELDVDDPRLRTNKTSQSLHHCSVSYYPCPMNDLATKAYPCKRNQEHKQE
jgi:hypothetical protein